MEKYAIVYANPPWMYNNRYAHPLSDNAPTEGRTNYYPDPMPTADIMALPVGNICEDNCVLFLWATTPILPEALSVVNAWGFTYKTLFTWEKTNDGCMGYWFKTCTEHLIIATKGNVKAFGCNVRNCYHEPKRKYGRKPEYFYRLIEKIAKGKRIELFARYQRRGWDAWGTNIDNAVPLINDTPFTGLIS